MVKRILSVSVTPLIMKFADTLFPLKRYSISMLGYASLYNITFSFTSYTDTSASSLMIVNSCPASSRICIVSPATLNSYKPSLFS